MGVPDTVPDCSSTLSKYVMLTSLTKPETTSFSSSPIQKYMLLFMGRELNAKFRPSNHGNGSFFVSFEFTAVVFEVG